MTNVQPQPPELAKSMGPRFHSMAPRSVSEFQPAAVAAAEWNPCIAYGQTGHRPMHCAKYLQECSRGPLRAHGCPACNAVELCPADCRRRLYFAAPRAEQGWHQPLHPMRPSDAAFVPTRAPSRTGSCCRTCRTESSSSCGFTDCRDRGFTGFADLDPCWCPNGAGTDSFHPAVDLDSQRHRVGAGCVRTDCDDGPTPPVSRGAYHRRCQPRTCVSAGSSRACGHKLPGECIDERRD